MPIFLTIERWGLGIAKLVHVRLLQSLLEYMMPLRNQTALNWESIYNWWIFDLDDLAMQVSRVNIELSGESIPHFNSPKTFTKKKLHSGKLT